MGCDIHFFVEKWSNETITEGPIDTSDRRDDIISDTLDIEKEYRWVSVDKWVKDEDIDGHWTNYDWKNRKDMAFYSGRNYDLFAKLADVRNWNNSITPLAEPKGVPDDASYAYNINASEMNGDGHSHSYFTLDELLDSGVDWNEFNFTDTIEKMGKVDPDPSNVRCVFFFDN